MMKSGSIYRHCKGKKYKIIAIGRCSEDCQEKMVVYQSLEESDYPIGTVWTRPLKNFIDTHSSGKKRFTRIVTVKIELITGSIIIGDLIHFGHKHPADDDSHPEREGWHYYKDNDTGEVHHLRKEHIVRVTEK